jgi:hypothetical protein
MSVDQLHNLIDLLMGKPGIIAATSASFAALYQIWKIVIDRKRERTIEREIEESNDQDTVQTLVNVITTLIGPTQATNRGRKKSQRVAAA